MTETWTHCPTVEVVHERQFELVSSSDQSACPTQTERQMRGRLYYYYYYEYYILANVDPPDALEESSYRYI